MKNIKLTIEYDGTDYCGWQRQNDQITIQGEIEKAILELTGNKAELIGSSRTDSGVHAKEMIANFKTNSSIPSEKFFMALNTKLPEDISIIKSEEVDINFHSRYDSLGKTYCYTIINRKEPISIMRNYCYRVGYKLDIDKMDKACKYFLGKHDFRGFRSLGGSVKTSVRTISDIHIETSKDKIKIYITADGFLYNMVRIIVGTLLKVGRGKISVEDIPNIILMGDTDKTGPCVPGNGLCLEKVYFQKNNFLKDIDTPVSVYYNK